MMEKFRSNKGVIAVRRLESLEEIASNYDIIINCSGIGAKELVSDASVHPIRGHIFRVSICYSFSLLVRCEFYLFIINVLYLIGQSPLDENNIVG